MTHIPRHKLDPEEIRPRVDRTREAMPTFVSGARRNPNNLTLLASNALELAAGLSVTDPDSEEIADWVQLAAQAYAGLFTVAAARGAEVEVPLGEDEPARYACAVDESIVHTSRWINAFFLNALCRDWEGLERLVEVPTDLLTGSSTRGPAYRPLLVDALRGFWNRDAGTSKLILAAMEATDPNKYQFNNPDWVLDLDVPIIELLFYVHQADRDFAEALPKAVTQHKRYWTRGAQQRRSWDGFLAFNLLGLTALAEVREMAFEVQSGYLPLSLVSAFA